MLAGSGRRPAFQSPTRAVRLPAAGGYRIDGAKVWCTNQIQRNIVGRHAVETQGATTA